MSIYVLDQVRGQEIMCDIVCAKMFHDINEFRIYLMNQILIALVAFTSVLT